MNLFIQNKMRQKKAHFVDDALKSRGIIYLNVVVVSPPIKISGYAPVASIALWSVGLQQLLHHHVTTHCCETLAQTLAMWWASDQRCQMCYFLPNWAIFLFG